MLVLSRKKNESIVVNDSIVITVVEIRGDKVRLGIEAPKEVPIHRSEIYEAIRRDMVSESPEDSDPELPAVSNSFSTTPSDENSAPKPC